MTQQHDRLPAGVVVRPLKPYRDARGCFTELFRREWDTGIDPVQWNVVHSDANVLRGVHLHRRHSDYLCVIQGRMFLGLHDTRPDSPTSGISSAVILSADTMSAVHIPVGVAHGFYYPEPAIHVYSVSHYWDLGDEFGCHWNSPELGIKWPCTQPILSDRDTSLGGYASMMSAYSSVEGHGNEK